MDKNAIKKYAVWARTELITRVSQRAEKYDITAEADANASSVNGVLLSDAEKKQRKALIEQVKQKGFDQVMEEVAYTWFNRFIALRFMEVNGYLPSHVRVFTDDNNNFKPQILTEAIHLELDGLDMDKVYEMKNSNENEELYKYLIIVQCNDLSRFLPGMFQKLADYTELLFPDNILREGSVIEQLISMIPQDNWDVHLENGSDVKKGQIQIIGWLYQYYNTEPKAKVFSRTNSQKITAAEVPAATELFTPDWIVNYLVQNSLGKIWCTSHRNDDVYTKWTYYVEGPSQKEHVTRQIEEKLSHYSQINPTEIKCLDPCMGSGHILISIFDVLIDIYEACGYSTREAASHIVKNNIYGLDIDKRAAQLSYFSIMMKARQYDRRFFTSGIQPNVYSIEDSSSIKEEFIDYFCDGNKEMISDVRSIVTDFENAKEYGSLIHPSVMNYADIISKIEQKSEEISFYDNVLKDSFAPLVAVSNILTNKYDVVVTNPPYMDTGSANAKLSTFLKSNYPDSKTDLFAVFIERCHELLNTTGMQAMITQHSWMFLGGYEKLREKLLNQVTITDMAHLGAHAFDEIGGEVVQTSAFVLSARKISDYAGTYKRLLDGTSEKEKESEFFDDSLNYYASEDDFKKIPSMPIGYWLSEPLLKCFDNKKISDFGVAKVGLQTGDNDRFVRVWFEVDRNKLFFGVGSTDETKSGNMKWFPYNKGGTYRKWYGNNDYIVNWENDGYEIKHNTNDKGKLRSRPQNTEYYFKESISWSKISMNGLAFRYKTQGTVFDVAGTSVFAEEKTLKYLLGLGNSIVAKSITQVLSPTLNYEVGHISNIPVIYENVEEVVDLVNKCIEISKEDWDSYELSWDFHKHPLIRDTALISDAFNQWEEECRERCIKLSEYETKINKIFIDMYGLQNELSPEVSVDELTIRSADRNREIKSLVSYGIGCIMGRYSLDKPGIVFAGGDWNLTESRLFAPDKDGIVPICDDEYFADDIVQQFISFISVAYGVDTVEENLEYISESLGGGAPRDVLRKYFLNDFYADHCSTYSVTGSGKRPIYWLFDSGKKNGFKCLVYMHRYQPDTIARIRTDYVHEQQARYRTAIEEVQNRLLSANGNTKVNLDKKIKKLREQDEELHAYEEKIHHLADQMISIDLDDGVKANYELFKDVLAKI